MGRLESPSYTLATSIQSSSLAYVYVELGSIGDSCYLIISSSSCSRCVPSCDWANASAGRLNCSLYFTVLCQIIIIINTFICNSTELDSHIQYIRAHTIEGNTNATQRDTLRDTLRDTQRDTYTEYILR